MNKHTSAISQGPSPSRRRYLDIDSNTTDTALGTADFSLRHSLVEHPLLSLDSLAALADSLPAKAIECLEGKQAAVAPGIEPALLHKPSETILSIETNGRWMALLNVEQIPGYRKLLEEVLLEVGPVLPRQEGGIVHGEAFIFLSSPDSMTPVHIDPENNFLLQIRGSKQVNVGEELDVESRRQEVERYLDGGHRNLLQLPVCSSAHSLQPGDGLYLPPWRPHWVVNGPAVSISLSITFRTQRSERYELASKFNSKLRRLGLSPGAVGASRLTDSLKAGLLQGKGWLQRGGRARKGSRDYS